MTKKLSPEELKRRKDLREKIKMDKLKVKRDEQQLEKDKKHLARIKKMDKVVNKRREKRISKGKKGKKKAKGVKPTSIINVVAMITRLKQIEKELKKLEKIEVKFIKITAKEDKNAVRRITNRNILRVIQKDIKNLIEERESIVGNQESPSLKRQ